MGLFRVKGLRCSNPLQSLYSRTLTPIFSSSSPITNAPKTLNSNDPIFPKPDTMLRHGRLGPSYGDFFRTTPVETGARQLKLAARSLVQTPNPHVGGSRFRV